jgi:hypothetical protein
MTHVAKATGWDTPYGHAMLKLERAKHHIDELDERLFTSSDRYGPSLHMDRESGEQFLYYSLRDYMLRGELATIAGDAIHNIRSALDIAWFYIVGEIGNPTGSGTFTKFPISPDHPKQWLEGALTKTAGIDPASRIYDFLVNQVKGYKGGDSDILAVHSLDIDDKHRLLIPTVSVTGVTGVELENEDGTIDVYNFTLVTNRESYRKVVPFGSKFKNHGEVRFYVSFGERTGLEGIEVIPTISRWQEKVWELLQWLWRMK